MSSTMRGPSGSGKTTSANLICNTSKEKGLSSAIHSTDTFFLDNLGNYVFDPKMLQEYHSKNRDAFQQSLKDGVNILVTGSFPTCPTDDQIINISHIFLKYFRNVQ